jgi:hypothetical protein
MGSCSNKQEQQKMAMRNEEAKSEVKKKETKRKYSRNVKE